MNFNQYDTEGFYDEYFDEGNRPRIESRLLIDCINALSVGDMARRKHAIDQALRRMGITFTVYGDGRGTEKIFPFDPLPRIVDSADWSHIEAGLKQRIRALNSFVSDVYGRQQILGDRIVPPELVLGARAYRDVCRGLRPPHDIWCHVVGTDLVRHSDGAIYVLEDNLRCPSGVSYVLQNRMVMKRTFPQVFTEVGVRPVVDYPSHLYTTLLYSAPQGTPHPQVVVLTPGVFNSAYYEHSFLAQQMGVELVEGRDLTVRDNVVYMRTTDGLRRVDVIYRRIDDEFLDPQVFRPDSLLGVPGLMEAFQAGNVSLANAPGTGIADDKALYPFVPDMIRFYLAEEPILPNVPTYVCCRDHDQQYVLEHIGDLVIKAANEAGGYGMLVGPHSTKAEQQQFAARIRQNPRNYIAQPTLSLSRVPTMIEDGIAGRRVDLRPYVLFGEEIWVLPGGLTRVALRAGSLVVNSSQGGGSKDTWVLARTPEEAAPPETVP